MDSQTKQLLEEQLNNIAQYRQLIGEWNTSESGRFGAAIMSADIYKQEKRIIAAIEADMEKPDAPNTNNQQHQETV